MRASVVAQKKTMSILTGVGVACAAHLLLRTTDVIWVCSNLVYASVTEENMDLFCMKRKKK